MGWFEDIFGGSNAQQSSQSVSSSSGSSYGQSTGTPGNYNPFFPLIGQQFAGTLGGYLGGGLPQYSGNLAAPITSPETSLLTGLQGVGQGSGPGSQGYLASVLGGQYLPGQEKGNPFLQAAITAAQRPTIQGLSDTLSRDLPGQFTAAGQSIAPNNANPQGGGGGSSAFDSAAAIATGRVANALGDIATNISSNAYNTERQLQQNAVPLSEQEVQTTINNLQAQALPRLISQLGIQNGMTIFQNSINSILQFLQTVGGVTAPAIANKTQSTQQASQSAFSSSQAQGQSQTEKGIIPDLTAVFSPGSGGSTPFGNALNAFR